MIEPNSTLALDRQSVALVRLIVTAGLFVLFTIGISIFLFYTLPLTWLAKSIVSIVVAWLLLRLPVPCLCVAVLASIGWTLHDHGTDNLGSSILITYGGCGLVLFRITYNRLRDRIVGWWSDEINRPIQVEAGMRPNEANSANPIDNEVMSLSGLIFIAVGVVLLSVTILTYFPLGGRMAKWMSWSIQNRQVLWPGPTMIVLIALFAIIIREWSWRDLTSTQAAMFLRTESLRLHFPDLFRIARYRLRQTVSPKKKDVDDE